MGFIDSKISKAVHEELSRIENVLLDEQKKNVKINQDLMLSKISEIQESIKVLVQEEVLRVLKSEVSKGLEDFDDVKEP